MWLTRKVICHFWLSICVSTAQGFPSTGLWWVCVILIVVFYRFCGYCYETFTNAATGIRTISIYRQRNNRFPGHIYASARVLDRNSKVFVTLQNQLKVNLVHKESYQQIFSINSGIHCSPVRSSESIEGENPDNIIELNYRRDEDEMGQSVGMPILYKYFLLPNISNSNRFF